MYDDIDRFENITDYSEDEIYDAYRMLKRMREMYQDADFSLTEILLARMMQTRDDGGESVWTVLGEIRDVLKEIDTTLSCMS